MKGKLRLAVQVLLSICPNVLKLGLYRALFGAKIGRGVKVGFGTILLFDRLELGDYSRISPLTLVRVRELRLGVRCSIGLFTRIIAHTVDLGPSVTIGPQVSILATTDDPRCVFAAGAESWIFEYCYINPARPIRLGRNVGVGGGSYMFAHGLWLSRLNGYPVGFAEITIGNDVWLPWGCFIMPGVTIGDGAVIGARSLVTRSVPAGALAAGSPAKVVREQVATDLSIPEKVAVLEETSAEFADRKSLRLSVERREEWVILRFDGVAAVVISTQAKAGTLPAELHDALVVVQEPLGEIRDRPSRIFSLRTYQSSPRHGFTDLQTAWLRHLRLIGTRYYPIDEVDVESAVA